MVRAVSGMRGFQRRASRPPPRPARRPADRTGRLLGPDGRDSGKAGADRADDRSRPTDSTRGTPRGIRTGRRLIDPPTRENATDIGASGPAPVGPTPGSGRCVDSSPDGERGPRREPIEIVGFHQALEVEQDSHLGEMMRSEPGITPVGREHERGIGFIMVKSDEWLLDGNLLKPRSKRSCRRSENLMRGAGIKITGAGIGKSSLKDGLDGILAPDDLSNGTAVEAIAQPKVNVDRLPREE